MNEPLRVLHGVLGSANQPWTLAHALRKRGHTADNILVSEHKFGYPATIHQPLKRGAVERALALVEDLASRFDVFHFHARSFVSTPSFDFPACVDLVQLRLLNKVVVFHFRGTEARLRSTFERDNPFHYTAEDAADLSRLYPPDEAAQRRMIDFVRSVADAVLVVDPEVLSYVPDAEIVPRAIDLEEWPAVGPVSTSRPLVVHAPSRPEVKGTQDVLAAVEALRAEGLAFEFELVRDLPHVEARRVYERADVIVDQLRTGWPGVLAVEGMALAKPVVSYIRPDLRPHLPADPPIAVADPTTVEAVLRELVLDASARERLGTTARRYCEQVHDADVVAERLEGIYRRLLEERPASVPAPQAVRRYLLAAAGVAEAPASRRRVLVLATEKTPNDARPLRLARALGAHGYEVTLAPAPRAETLSEKRARRAWGETLRRERPDILHAHGHEGLAPAISMLGRATRVVYEADPSVLDERPVVDSLRRLVLRIDGVVTSSSVAAGRLESELGLLSPPVVIDENWPAERQEQVLLELYERVLAPKDDRWYDRFFASWVTDSYRRPYAESIYYECWERVAGRLQALGARSVLDIGCGPGQFAAFLRDKGVSRYLGIDFSAVAIEQAREACPEFEFRPEDARTSTALADHPYDVALLLETLEHIAEDREVLGRIREGTPVIATVPDFPAQAHVRHFTSETEVAERYGDLLDGLSIERVVLTPKAGLFVLEGISRAETATASASNSLLLGAFGLEAPDRPDEVAARDVSVPD